MVLVARNCRPRLYVLSRQEIRASAPNQVTLWLLLLLALGFALSGLVHVCRGLQDCRCLLQGSQSWCRCLWVVAEGSVLGGWGEEGLTQPVTGVNPGCLSIHLSRAPSTIHTFGGCPVQRYSLGDHIMQQQVAAHNVFKPGVFQLLGKCSISP